MVTKMGAFKSLEQWLELWENPSVCFKHDHNEGLLMVGIIESNDAIGKRVMIHNLGRHPTDSDLYQYYSGTTIGWEYIPVIKGLLEVVC